MALDRDRDPGRAPIHAALEGLAMSHDHKPSIVLAELWERQSQHGNTYFSGFWGGLSVALLRDGERPHPTRPDETVVVWRLVAQEREPREGRQKPPARPPERDSGPGRGNWSLEALARVLTPLGGPLGARARRRGGNAWPARWRPPTGSARAIPMMRCRSEPPPSLDEIARRVARLHPSWCDPQRFFEERSDLAHALRWLARNGPPEAPGHPAGPSPQVQRLAALARAQAARITRLERQLAEACRPRPRRRRVPDARQLVLTF
jgi:hypothetical protein